MLVVDLVLSRKANYVPLTVDAGDYLMELGRFIARTVADVEVHAHPDRAMTTEAVFRSTTAEDLAAE